MSLTKKYVIKRQQGFSEQFFSGFERHEAEPSWSGYLNEAEQFHSPVTAEHMLSHKDEHGWHVFEDGIYWVDEIWIKETQVDG